MGRTPGLGYVFKHANKLYFEQDLKLNECLQLALDGQLELVDFKNSPDQARLTMNKWVEDNTEGRITDLVPEGYVDYSIKRDKIRMVKYMVQKGSFNYYVSEELKAHVLELPYEDDTGDSAGSHLR